MNVASGGLYWPGPTYKLADDTKGFSPPLIERPDAGEPRLSFNNLVEAHVLRALRVEHHVPMGHVREVKEAIVYESARAA